MNKSQKIRFKHFMDMARENLELAQENTKLKKELEEYRSGYKVLLKQRMKGVSL